MERAARRHEFRRPAAGAARTSSSSSPKRFPSTRAARGEAGLTGWAQVKYRYGASIEDATEKLRYDLYYIKHLSLGFDLTIVIDTVKVILFGKGAQ